MPEAKIKQNAETTPAVYSPAARHLHWTTVALIAAQVPLGIAMSYRGNVLNLWDTLTNALYSWHKLIGVVILLLVIVRLAYRLTRSAPSDEPTLEPWQKLVSHSTHWAIYGLLVLVPITGWIGVSYYPALSVFGFNLPALVSPDQAAAAKVFFAHMIGAILLVVLIGMHVGAALFHYVIRKDGVLNRMLPSLPRRDGK